MDGRLNRYFDYMADLIKYQHWLCFLQFGKKQRVIKIIPIKVA